MTAKASKRATCGTVSTGERFSKWAPPAFVD